jgi:enoyl-CoA hydratase/carnithine racemase
MQTENIQLEKKDRIATITLNRPEKLNAVTPEMADALRDAAAEVNGDPEIRIVILTGAGPKSFCAGSDIKELDNYETPWEFRNRPDYCDAIRDIRKPIICAVNGYCLGGGLELAMTCDIRIASENAIFGAPEIKLGWVGGGGMAFALAHSIGSSNAAMMLYTGDPVNAKKALSWGLVSEVVALEGLLTRSYEIASVIAQRPPIAAQTAKVNLRAAYSMTREDAVRYERDLRTICFATDDAAEGRRAFKEKRNPTFLGR